MSVTTTLPGGTDNQVFCYDDLNRLTWAGSSGTPSCGTTLTAGTLTTAQYSASYGYDNLNRLTSGPLGSYTYGDSNHLHAATSVGSGWTGSYDAAGDLTCRAATVATTCTGGSPTGAHLSYDATGQLSHWQDQASSPNSTADYLYDGEGNRVLAQTSTSGGSTTTTAYVSNLEDITTSGGTTTTTAYYYLAGKRVALSVNGTLSYLLDDGLGSANVALDASGTATASQLYDAYGSVRYQQGSMPGSFGYTGQRDDTASPGLDYYGARYYDPAIGQFASADSTLAGGLNRYAYVGGNPETETDPSGHCPWCVVGAIVGAVVGAAIVYGTQVYNNYQSGAANPWTDNIDWGSVAMGALAGALVGGTMGAGATAAAGILAAGGSVGSAAVAGGTAAVTFAAYGVAPEVGGDLAINEAEVAAAETEDDAVSSAIGCGGLSFSADTRVATPQGSQPIDTLRVGDPVTAVNPTSGKTSTQTVQRVFINHDTDLLDVTLRTVDTDQPTATPAADPGGKQRAVNQASHGSHAPPATTDSTTAPTTTHDETVHTTASHPWLTADHGFVRAGELTVGERVREADGHTAEVVALSIVPGAANMWDLTVSNVHTFAVGDGAFIVHNVNCKTVSPAGEPYDRSKLGHTPSPAANEQVIPEGATCHWCGGPATVSDHEPSLASRWAAGEYDGLSPEDRARNADDPSRMVPSCTSCNGSKSGKVVGSGPGEWDPRTSPNNRARGGSGMLPWDPEWGTP